MKSQLEIRPPRDLASLIAMVLLVTLQCLFAANIAGDTIQGNLIVTDTGAFTNGIDFGTTSQASLYWSNDFSNTTISDIFSIQGSFLWRDSVTGGPSFKEKMRLDTANNLVLYNPAGTMGAPGIPGVFLNPAHGSMTLSNSGENSGIFFGTNATATLKAASNGSAIFPNSVTLQGTSGVLRIDGTTSATSSADGALTVVGGIGVGKDSYFNGVRLGRGLGNIATNTVVGSSGLNTNTTGWENSASGIQALFANTTGYRNSAFGSMALLSNTNGWENTAIGSWALKANMGGAANTATGSYALVSNSRGHFNSAFGSTAMMQNTTGLFNSAFGFSALRLNTTGQDNAAVGLSASHSNTTGRCNSTTGSYALYSNTTGSSNVALGFNAGRYQSAGSSLTDPENSIYIGTNSRGRDNNDNNSIVIGYGAIGEGANTTVIGSTSMSKTRLYGDVEVTAIKAPSGPDAKLILKGQVALETPQGDISMGDYQ